jgi:hypothetical protein
VGEESLGLSGKSLQPEYDALSRRNSYSFNGSKRRFTIKPRPRALNDTPYWIMQVPPSLIADHSAIFGRDSLRLMGALLSLSGALEADARTVMVREDGVRPIGMSALPSGALVFVDRTRRVYSIEPGSDQPVFRNCLVQIAQPEDTIGLSTHKASASVVLNRPEGLKSSGYQTEVRTLTMTKEGLEIGHPLHVPGEQRFAAATVDLAGRKVFLATGASGEIFVADLEEKKKERRPRLLVTAPDATALTVLFHSPDDRQLYAADGAAGFLYRLDPSATSPELKKIAENLGQPTMIAADSTEGRLYLGDSKGRQIWELECADAGCSQPRVFARHDAFASPEQITRGVDGSLWVADRAAHKIFRLSASGDIVQQIDRVPTY